MTSVCEFLIKQDIDVNCLDPIVPGIEQNGVILNRKDIDFGATIFDAIRKNVIKTLVAKKRGYGIYVPSPTAFNNTTTVLEKGTNRNTFTNNIGFVILNNDPDVCEKIIDGLANGSFIVIYENKYKNPNKETTPGDSAFQVAGWYQGLIPETIENNKYSADTDGGWAVLLKENKVPRSGLFLFDTDYETTKKHVESILGIA